MIDRPVTLSFFYYNYFPIKGGASVHGYNLAKELSKQGVRLIKINGNPDLFTQKKKGVLGLVKAIKQSDVVFVRLDYFFKPRNLIPVLAYILNKPVVAELNSPSDELLLLGDSRFMMKVKEQWLKLILRYVDRLITVSQPNAEFCKEILNYEDVRVIENGGEVFGTSNPPVETSFVELVHSIRGKYSKIVIWSGSTNKLQEIDFLKEIAATLDSDYAMIIITPSENVLTDLPSNQSNVFQFSDLSREELGLAIQMADIGLAFFTDYSWCRWGYYNSSLKVYEYLSNYTHVVTNKEEIKSKHPYTKVIKNPSAINDYCRELNSSFFKNFKPRTWKDVANEVIEVLKDVLEERK